MEQKERLNNFSLKDKVELNVKTAGILLTSDHLTGSGMTSYSPVQGIVPGQASNFRDLLDTVSSPTGIITSYRESNTVQLPGIQTEGSAKTTLDYTFVSQAFTGKYIAGKVTFSKQFMYQVGFIQQVLPTMLLRDFYKKENDYFFTTMAQNSTGSVSTPGTANDAEELLQSILNQRKANFVPSYALVDWTQLGRLLTTKPADYSIPGGFFVDGNGNLRVLGVPVIGATWAQTDHVLIYDRAYYQRAETESLRVEFSYENNDNFEKNLVTARVECFEELQRLRDDASVYHDFGNS